MQYRSLRFFSSGCFLMDKDIKKNVNLQQNHKNSILVCIGASHLWNRACTFPFRAIQIYYDRGYSHHNYCTGDKLEMNTKTPAQDRSLHPLESSNCAMNIDLYTRANLFSLWENRLFWLIIFGKCDRPRRCHYVLKMSVGQFIKSN